MGFLFKKTKKESALNVNEVRSTVMTERTDENQPAISEGWGVSEQYGDLVIKDLKRQLTPKNLTKLASTPTPFNRLTLTDMAFKYVVDQVDEQKAADDPRSVLDGQTVYHKLISESLDVGELFFYQERHQDILKLIEWNREKDLKALIEAADKDRYFGEALKLFLNPLPKVRKDSNGNLRVEEEKREPNYGALALTDISKIYLLNCPRVADDAGLKILGGTSPYTLFFAADCHKEQTNFLHGERRLFDEKPVPLFRRHDERYLKFWFALKQNWIDLTNDLDNEGKPISFEQRFPTLSEYLSLTHRALQREDPDLAKVLANKEELKRYWEHTLCPLSVGEVDVSPFSTPRLTLKQSQKISPEESHFKIRPSRGDIANAARLPLVLPVDNKRRYTGLRYTSDYFNEELPVPESTPIALDARQLPGEAIVYPYLTESDFLYDKMLVNHFKPVKPVESESNFLYCNEYNYDGDYSVLLPIKPLYFNYFTVEDLRQHLTVHVDQREEGKPRVTVRLKIPIQGERQQDQRTIEYVRTYYGTGDRASNEKSLHVERLVVGVYPFIKLLPEERPNGLRTPYRVMLSYYKPRDGALPLRASFYAYHDGNVSLGGEDVTFVERNRRQDGSLFDRSYPAVKSYAVAPFDYIEVVFNDDYRGILIPDWQTLNPQRTFEVAVDFGTSNTHVDGRNITEDRYFGSRAEKILAQTQFQFFSDYDFEALPYLRKVLRSDFFPEKLGEEYNYPIRTVVNAGANVAWGPSNIPLAEVNIPFAYGEHKLCPYDEPIPDLKWGTEPNRAFQRRAFLASLLYQLRNRLLSEGASITKTKLTFFFPKSMHGQDIDKLRKDWRALYTTYFGEDVGDNLKEMLESLAPFYYYCHNADTNGRFLCIDVGGETTDVVFARAQGRPVFVTSFRFASSALYGVGCNRNMARNGFVRFFSEKILLDDNFAKSNDCEELREVFNYLMEKGNVMEMMSFFFSLNKSTVGKVCFEQLLQNNPQFFAVYVIYFSAIMYHLAQMLKVEKVLAGAKENIPQYIAFTGNGSKAFTVIDGSPDRDRLRKLARSIFAYVLEEDVAKGRTKMFLEDNPKEKLCRGGLTPHDEVDGEAISKVLLGDRELTVLSGEVRMRYDQLSSEQKDSVVANVRDFYDMLLTAMNGRISYDGLFTKQCRVALFSQLTEEQENGVFAQNLETMINQRGAEAEINETLFFFPIIGSLGAIAERIANEVKNGFKEA